MKLIPRRRSRRRGWTVGDVFWLATPVLALTAVVAYFAAAVLLGTTPPFSVVSGQSMRPTFAPGDLVVIQGVAADEVGVGDVISIVPPPEEQREKGLPSEIVHRVVDVEGSAGQPVFITKGDNNSGEDAFRTFPPSVRGEVVARVPGLGFPVLFLRSSQGRIFAIAAGLALIGYFLISAIERRQEAAALENPRALIDEVREENHEMKEVMKELVGAVSTYGEHLKSHTGAVQGMSAASQELAGVAADLRGSLAGTAAPASAEAPARREERDFLDELLGSSEAPTVPTPVAVEPVPEVARPQRLETRYQGPRPGTDLRADVLDHLRLVSDDGWIDLDLEVLAPALDAPVAALESALAHLALGGHLRAVAKRQSVTYLVRLR